MRLIPCLIIFFSLVLSLKLDANTDVYVADLIVKGSRIDVLNVKNISQRKGYDNQPHFASDGSGIYFTAMFEKASKSQADIVFYRYADGSITNISKTPHTSEYSATEIEDGNALSVIKVEPDNKQRLWKINIKDASQTILNKDIEPVGYHAWGRERDLALFVLGEPMTLQYINTISEPKGLKVASDIGRSIRFNKRLNGFSFSYGKQHQVAVYLPKQNKTQTLTQLPSGSQYYTWYSDEVLLSAQGSEIKQWQKNQGWRTFIELSKHCRTEISRLAVNQQKSKLAFVCEEENQ